MTGHSPGPAQLRGAEVLDASRSVVGAVSALLIDPVTRQGRWLRLSLRSGGDRLVPLEVASVDSAGRVSLPFDAATLIGAPTVDSAAVTDDEAASLSTYFGLTP